ncbi:MAG: hypothetical protein AMK72_05905 [Planctomycetes bacterium SM23_25]|nr:MAG: hypothetical protein AMK72_05905 [Planctomycetes bacterium SM23_25]
MVSFACAACPLFAEDAYDAFNRFCLANFGAEKEPLVHETFGRELKVVPEGSWRHVSENSACIAWETNLPAKSHVEYGEGDAFNLRTRESERFFYLHIHCLTGLETGKTYRYRLVSVDERGGRVVTQETAFTLETKKIPGAIYVPGDMAGPPYRLDRRGATYVLTADVASDSTAFGIVGRNITLDLNGFTVSYNNAVGAKDPRPASAGEGNQSEHGVTIGYNSTGVRVLNGRIVQGRGAEGLDKTWRGGSWFQPVYACEGAEIAGLTLDYSGRQVGGIRGGVAEIHHNVIVDRGMEVLNRHQGVDAIMATPRTARVHHNLVKRCRQRGIASGVEVAKNEIYVDSCATNSFGIFYWGGTDRVCRDNRIFGTGYLAEGIGLNGPARSICRNIRVHRNFIHMQAVAPLDRWKEYGKQSGAYGIRIHHSVQDCEFTNNVSIGYARDGGMIRPLWYSPYPAMKNLVIRDNVFKGIAQNEKSDTWGTIVVCGCDGDPKDYPVTLFRDNRIISNFCHVRLSEPYGMGINALFVNNTFERVGGRANYRLVHAGYWKFQTTGTRFIDSVFKGDTGYDKVVFEGTGEREFSVGFTLTVKTAPGASVTITGKDGREAHKGVAAADGSVRVQLLAYTHTPDGKRMLTPHTVTVELDGRKSTQAVTMDVQKELSVE